MTRALSTALPLLLCCVALSCSMVSLCCVAITAAQPEPHPETYLAVSDKPCVEIAESAQEAAEELEAETYQYEQIGGVETYSGYWYTSDDEEAEAAAKEWIAWRESGGDYNSRNGRYIGRYQLNEMYLDGDYSEEAQEAAADAYIADRYGSWQAAQEHHREYGWY